METGQLWVLVVVLTNFLQSFVSFYQHYDSQDPRNWPYNAI